MSQENNRKKHDEFVRNTLADLKDAQSFLQKYIPAKYLKDVDMTTLYHHHTKHTDSVLKVLENDVVLHCKKKSSNEAAAFIFIVEHQSTNDKEIVIRLKKYEIALVEYYSKNKKKCPTIFCSVLYNGDEKYTAKKNYFDLFADPKQQKEVSLQDYNLINLNEKTVHELLNMTSPKLGFRLCLMNPSAIMDDKDTIRKCNIIFKTLSETEQTECITYGADIKNKKEISTILNSNDPMRNAFDRKKEEGRQEGRQENQVEIVRNMLAEGIDLQVISKVTGLSEAQIQMIKKN